MYHSSTQGAQSCTLGAITLKRLAVAQSGRANHKRHSLPKRIEDQTTAVVAGGAPAALVARPQGRTMPRDLAAATRRAWERLERLLAHRKSPLLANLAPGTTDVALDRFEQETKQTLPADGRDALEKLVFASCWAEFLHKTADAIEAGEVECSEGMTLVSESRVASFDDAWLPFCNRRGSDGRAEDD